MSTQTAIDPSMMLNLSTYHHEHEKFYAFQPMEKALDMQRASRVLLTLADRWSRIQPGEAHLGNPYLGAEDLNETSTIQHTGVLFLEGEGEPAEIGILERDLHNMADDLYGAGAWLSTAMESSWRVAQQTVRNPLMAGVLGERHRIIANDWESASHFSLIATLLHRALDILEQTDLSPSAIRSDLAGPRFTPQYLYAAAELIDRAADLAAQSAILIHDNERRWRVFHDQVAQVASKPLPAAEGAAPPLNGRVMISPQPQRRQPGKAGLADLSRSVAHLDLAAAARVAGLVAGAVVLGRRVNVSRSSVLVSLATLASLGTVILRLGRRSGATDEEMHRSLAGDNVIPQSYTVTDRAITVKASVEEAWPWIVQMGYHRGGWYTSRWLDKLIWHIDNPSADRIVPEYQNVHVGDVIPDGEPGKAYFTVAALEQNRHIVYLDDAGSHVPGVTFSWAFVLRPLDESTTRIQVRWRNGPVSSPLLRGVVRLLVAPADFVMMNQVLGGIKRRAEAHISGPHARNIGS
jgi:hypothetical protein